MATRGEDGTIGSQAIAGPSRTPPTPADPPTTAEIPSFGLQFFEYRRRLFLAGQPLPEPPITLPDKYTITLPLPDPVPPLPRADVPSSAIGRLEALLDEDGLQEANAAWRAGVQGVHAHLTGRRKLAKPMRLGLVIKILRAGWIKDGTWPLDPKTRRAMAPPESPILSADLDAGDPLLGGEAALRPKSDQGQDAALVNGQDILDGLIGKDDLHVGTNVWRGAEQGLEKTG